MSIKITELRTASRSYKKKLRFMLNKLCLIKISELPPSVQIMKGMEWSLKSLIVVPSLVANSKNIEHVYVFTSK